MLITQRHESLLSKGALDQGTANGVVGVNKQTRLHAAAKDGKVELVKVWTRASPLIPVFDAFKHRTCLTKVRILRRQTRSAGRHFLRRHGADTLKS